MNWVQFGRQARVRSYTVSIVHVMSLTLDTYTHVGGRISLFTTFRCFGQDISPEGSVAICKKGHDGGGFYQSSGGLVSTSLKGVVLYLLASIVKNTDNVDMFSFNQKKINNFF